MKKSIILDIMLCLGMVAFAQQSMQWYSYWGSNTSQIEPQRMAVDANGDIYVAAQFGGTTVNVEGTTLSSHSGLATGDAVIVKMTANKQVVWVYPIVNVGNATITDIAIDKSGNVVATGAFNNSIKVGNNTMAVDDSNLGEQAIYVLRLTAAGQAINAFQIPSGEARGGKIAIDSQNNIIVTGILDGDATFITGGDPEGDFQGTSQMFVAKYNANGVHQWHQFRNGIGSAVYGKTSVAVDANDNIYVATSISGTTTFAGKDYIAGAISNPAILCYSSQGVEQWSHMIWGDQADEAGDITTSPIGEVIMAVNHHSGSLFIDNDPDEYKNGYAFDVAFQHTGFFSFDTDGDFKWFYDWGYSNGTSGSDAVTYALRCTDEGVIYVAGMMTGRYGGSRLPSEERTLPDGKNSGVETVDNQWLQHNTNGGQDCFLLTITRDGKLVNAARPGGTQYEYGMDVALSPDKKSIYLLMHINVRDKQPYTCPDNLFDSFADLYPTLSTAPSWGSRKQNYTLLNVFCPENDGSSTAYTTAYKGAFASSLLVKYAMPEINPNNLPYFQIAQQYSQVMSMPSAQGVAHIHPLECYGDVGFDGTLVTGAFPDANPRYVGLIAIDSIALPAGGITYYEYDNATHKSLRSQPRNCRYMPLLEGEETALNEVSLDAGIYPTLCKDNLHISCAEPQYVVNIYTMDGRMIFSKDNVAVIGVGGHLSAGMYQVEVRAGNARKVASIIVQ